jgi:anhydro-N-acetylmuramic acid kinase
MSGTSLDGVDAALLRTDGEMIGEFGPTVSHPFSAGQREMMSEAVSAALAWNWNGAAPSVFKLAEAALHDAHVEAWRALAARITDAPPLLAGFHGQTVLHRPPSGAITGRTLQIGDGASLATAIGIPVVWDLRSADVAAGGHGAPLAPAYHRALLGAGSGWRFAVNIGGVSNITACGPGGELIAFDTGPGNGPLDQWMVRHRAGRFDEGGLIAKRGRIDERRIEDWMSRPFFRAPPPRSADRYDFTADLAQGLSFEDGAATLAAFTARAIISGVRLISPSPETIVVMGGGRKNKAIMDALAGAFPGGVTDADERRWRGDAIEAEAWAFLAARSVRDLPVSFPGTTGAPRAMTGGRLSVPRSVL